jgi:hypothetical protein
MKNIVTLAIIVLLVSVIHAQKEEIPTKIATDYSLEIWNIEVQSKEGFNYLEIDVFNSGDNYPAPSIQVIHNDIFIVNAENKPQTIEMPSNGFHKFEFPVEFPNSHDGKKIKLEVKISNKDHSMSQKFKIKVAP